MKRGFVRLNHHILDLLTEDTLQYATKQQQQQLLLLQETLVDVADLAQTNKQFSSSSTSFSSYFLSSAYRTQQLV